MHLKGFPFCMMFLTKESKLDTNFQPSLLSNTELSHKIIARIYPAEDMYDLHSKNVLYLLPVLTGNTETSI